MISQHNTNLNNSYLSIVFTACLVFVGFPQTAMACPPGWECLPGHTCPPIDYCVPASTPPAEPTVPPPAPTAPPPEPQPEPYPTPGEPPSEPPVTPSPTPSPMPTPTDPPAVTPPSQPPTQPPAQPPAPAKTPDPSYSPTVGIRLRPDWNTNEALEYQWESQSAAEKDLEYIEVTGTRIPRNIRDSDLISSQIGRLSDSLMIAPEGEDSWTTPPGTPYGEELDNPPVGIALKREDDRWIPRYGNSTLLIAKIYTPDPEREGVWLPNNSVRRKMTLRFVSRSKEPGKALNADLDQSPQDSPDLYLNATRNTGTHCSDDPVGRGHFNTCTTDEDHNEFIFVVSSEDYGGYSKLDVSCPDCVPLVRVPGAFPESFRRNQYWELGVVETDINKRATKVPKDTNDNQVADGYPPDRLEWMSPAEDSESMPAGNGTDGDGLGAYEEYRGFIDRHGNHRRTDWFKKTLFVENIHQISLYLFTTQSELETVELDTSGHRSRIVNFNHGHGHVVEQHGLILRMSASLDDAFAGYCYCDRERPKGSDRVVVKPAYRHKPTVAHELGHAVGMSHHGEVDWPEYESIRAMTNTWRDLLPGKVHSSPMLCGYTLPHDFKVGTKGDQGSGNHNCIMRYGHYHYVYEQAGGDFDCMPSAARTLFDDSATGTGPNRMGRTASDASLGNCKSQIWISSK